LAWPVSAQDPSSQLFTGDDYCAAGQAGAEQPIAPERLIGTWVDDTGNTVEIAAKSPGDKTNFILRATREWDGIYKDGQLVFTRTPTAAEMSQKAPDWARKKVQGQIKWSIELQVSRKCQEPMLKGKWYPGELSYVEETAPDGGVAKQEASVTGKGTPVDIVYSRPPHVLVLAKTLTGYLHVDKFYERVPLVVGVFFEGAHDGDEYPITVRIGDRSLDLIAKPVDASRTTFLTDVFAVVPP
jgi:hypothetical protein